MAYFVNRWYDEAGIPHYFGIRAEWQSLAEAKANAEWNLLDVTSDFVYMADTEAEMSAYQRDVLVNCDDTNDDIGTRSWLGDE
jgi:hypothetical protein